jgi:hypothetical protein
MQFFKSINLLHVTAPRCNLQEYIQIEKLQAKHANLTFEPLSLG